MIQLEQMPIDKRVGQEVLRLMPQGWAGATVSATRAEQGPSSESCTTVTPRPQAPGLVNVSEELQNAIRALFLLHKRHNTKLRVARYLIDKGNGSPKLVAEFEYDD